MTTCTAFTLLAAIGFEVLATLALKASEGLTRLWPIPAVIVGYGAAFVLLGLTLKTTSVGVAYALWSGIGTAMITIAGAVLFHERLSMGTLAAIALTLVGAVLINLTSQATH